MKTLPTIRNVKIDPSVMGATWALRFDDVEGNRLHIWFDVDKLDASPGDPLASIRDNAFAKAERGKPILYKNPPSTASHMSAPGYFKTKHLNPDTASNRPLVAEAFRQMIEGGMIAEFRRKAAEEETARLARAQEEARNNRIRANAVPLYKAALAVVNYDTAAASLQHERGRAMLALKMAVAACEKDPEKAPAGT